MNRSFNFDTSTWKHSPITEVLQVGKFLTSIDPIKAYLHVPILPSCTDPTILHRAHPAAIQSVSFQSVLHSQGVHQGPGQPGSLPVNLVQLHTQG